ncbi:MAG: UDP-N-acetylmuramoyl-tripeptide--D-alanyl-D-alanine ligase [Candidatus Lloydbacteria bacterium]|nr:UDP-N-acetylmuramoyl-tripeptide--D-alanyl-D-alanine ligase [Candidatus Lloydbacteria bacterium]
MPQSFFKKIIIFILTLEARLVLRKYRPIIVAVTGSVGKTSTKDAIYSILAKQFYTRKSEKSFNSDIGIPLAILGCPNGWYDYRIWLSNIAEGARLICTKNHYPKWLVLEVGADRPGDIKKVAEWLSPDIVVVTRFADVPVHVEFFSSPEELVREKTYLVEALKPDGLLVLNHDDKQSAALKEKTRARVITFGFEEGARIRASNEEIFYKINKEEDASGAGFEVPEGITFKVSYVGSTVPVKLTGAFGTQHIYAVLAGFAIGVVYGINMVAITEALVEFVPPPGRLRRIDGQNGSIILDDSYNASPVATEAALGTLASLRKNGQAKKIAVLGDMLELGKYSTKEHARIGEQAAKTADMLVAVGVRAKMIAESALSSGIPAHMVHVFEDSREAGEFLKKVVGQGDIILVKGSQSMRMEQVVLSLMKYPEEAPLLLARQETVWKEK